MQLEDYFLFELPTVDRIRIRGTRIAIEHILEPYLEGDSPERIFQSYRRILTLEQVYATITYYLHCRPEIDAYLERSRKHEEEAYQEHLKKEKPEIVKRLQKAMAERLNGTVS